MLLNFVRPGSFRGVLFSPPSRYSIGSVVAPNPEQSLKPACVIPSSSTRKLKLRYGSTLCPVAMSHSYKCLPSTDRSGESGFSCSPSKAPEAQRDKRLIAEQARRTSLHGPCSNPGPCDLRDPEDHEFRRLHDGHSDDRDDLARLAHV